MKNNDGESTPFLFFNQDAWRWNHTSEQTTTTHRRRIGQGQGSKKQQIDRSEKAGHVSPAILVKYLKGMNYPASKENMVDSAQSKTAPQDVMDLIAKLPNKTYKSPIDVTKEIGKIE
ncbi:MAG: DUF2795 domain-containing protein [Candidatus Bathyarchaeota archaeon]|nr:DUF2795 domain-containing protein [Candidatus Termitimicrobium sp.]